MTAGESRHGCPDTGGARPCARRRPQIRDGTLAGRVYDLLELVAEYGVSPLTAAQMAAALTVESGKVVGAVRLLARRGYIVRAGRCEGDLCWRIVGAETGLGSRRIERAVYEHLVACAREGRAPPLYRHLAAMLGVHPDRIGDAMRVLMTRGEIERVKGRRGYRIAVSGAMTVIPRKPPAQPKVKIRSVSPPVGARRPAPRPVARSRACLCCGQMFSSAGAHNRLCSACRRGASDPLSSCRVAL